MIAYASKRLPEVARNYLITELESCGQTINIASFSHLLKRVDFDTIVDHLALTHIIKSNSKAEPATTRIKRLLQLISSYLFNLYSIKGKDMILSDFLSRQKHDDSNPHIIPISFNICKVLHKNYYNIGIIDRYLVQTESQTKSSSIKLPEVHSVKKTLDTNTSSEKQKITPQITSNVEIKPRLGKGGAEVKCKKPQATKNIDAVTDKLLGILRISTVQNIPKNSLDFPMHEQSISSSKTEAIT